MTELELPYSAESIIHSHSLVTKEAYNPTHTSRSKAQPKKTMDYTDPAIIARELKKSVMGLLVYTPANSEFQEGQEFYNHSLVS